MTVSLFGVGGEPGSGSRSTLKAGVDRIVFLVPPAPADVVLPALEKRARLAEQFA